MANMRTSIAFALFWVNLIVASLNIYFSVSIGNQNSSSSGSSSSSSSTDPPVYSSSSGISTFRPTIKPYIPSSIFKPTINPSTFRPTVPSYLPSVNPFAHTTNPFAPKTNPFAPTYNPFKPKYNPFAPKTNPFSPTYNPFKPKYYFLEDENQTPNELRKLSISDIRYSLLFVNISSFLFIIMLMMSFYATKNECCCNEDENDRNALCAAGCCCACCDCCYECSFTFSGIFFLRGTENPKAKITLIVLIIILFVFLVIYAAIKACGKLATRIVSLIGLILINLVLAILSFISGSDKFCILMGVLSLVTAILDFLGLVLPNCSSCEKLSYEYLYSYDQTTKEDSNPQQLLIFPQENVNSNEEEIYNKPEAEVPNQVNQYDYPNSTDTNPGYDYHIRDSTNAPAPIYQVDDNNYSSNQVENDITINYPKPE